VPPRVVFRWKLSILAKPSGVHGDWFVGLAQYGYMNKNIYFFTLQNGSRFGRERVALNLRSFFPPADGLGECIERYSKV